MYPTVSVVIPTFNRKNIVLEAIHSVLAQEPKNFEVIVVDDGSTDGTTEYLESLHLPIRVIRKQNGGISNSRNTGIKESKGKFIAFLDSDDVWLPGILKEQLSYLEKHPNIPLVYTDQFIEVEGKRLDKTRFEGSNASQETKTKFVLPGFVQFTPIHASSVMARKSLFDEIGMFDESLQVHEDTELWNRISEKYELGFIDVPLAVFRWEKDPEHILNASSRKKFISEGRKYLGIYKQRCEQRGLTNEEREAIEESEKRLSKLEELIEFQEKEQISEEEFQQKKEKIFT